MRLLKIVFGSKIEGGELQHQQPAGVASNRNRGVWESQPSPINSTINKNISMGLCIHWFCIYLFIFPVELRARKILKVETSNFGGGGFKGVKVHGFSMYPQIWLFVEGA